jgi:thioredoxin-like negative regulator of GroEL
MSTNFDFDKKVIQESYNQPVIVEFSSPGCGPCLWMEKTLVEVVKEMKNDVHLVSLPISDCPQCVEQYKIVSNPTTIFFSKGEPLAQLKGTLPKMVVKQWVEDHL